MAEDSSQRGGGVDATPKKTNYEEQSEQISSSEERKISSHVSDGVSAVTAYDHLTSQANEKANHPTEQFEFEMQYGLSSKTFGGILHEILVDMSTFRHIHNWDEKLFTGPLKSILKVVQNSWGENRCTWTSLRANSTVEEIREMSDTGTDNAPTATEEAGEVGSYLFFTKVGGGPYHKFGI